MKKVIFALIVVIGLSLLIVLAYNKMNVKKESSVVIQKTETDPLLNREPDYKASISISNYGFMPSDLVVREGDVFELSIISVDSSKHSFSFSPKIDRVNKVEVDAGKTVVIKFIVPAVGVYNYGCQEPGHEEEIGKMTVITKGGAAISKTNSDVAQEAAPINPAYKLMISVSGDGYYPKEFSANAGQPVELTILPVDNNKHTFKFVQAVAGFSATVLEAGKKNVINFQAPAVKGTYDFICSEVGHEKETGKMIVN